MEWNLKVRHVIDTVGDLEETGDWGADNLLGGDTARRLVQYMQETGNPGILGHVAKAIGLKGRHGGIEVGFWSAVVWMIRRNRAAGP